LATVRSGCLRWPCARSCWNDPAALPRSGPSGRCPLLAWTACMRCAVLAALSVRRVRPGRSRCGDCRQLDGQAHRLSPGLDALHVGVVAGPSARPLAQGVRGRVRWQHPDQGWGLPPGKWRVEGESRFRAPRSRQVIDTLAMLRKGQGRDVPITCAHLPGLHVPVEQALSSLTGRC
jgi:hypothetical protein